jgi:hypothetical protein
MASIINATTSTGLVSSADNSGSLQLATNNGTTAVTIDTSQTTTINSPSSTPLIVQSAGTERMRITSGGVLALGTTGAAWRSGDTVMQMGGYMAMFSDGNATTEIANNMYLASGGRLYLNTGAATRYMQYLGEHTWHTAPSGTAGTNATFTERMRITSGGLVYVNTTATIADAQFSLAWNASGNVGMGLKNTFNGSFDVMRFLNYNNVQQGYINCNNSGSTTYNSGSDYRFKDNVQPMTDGLSKVMQLKPVTFNWKGDNSAGQGFIAHELAEIVPDIVSGEKDAVTEDGTIKPQGVDYGKLTAVLTSAIQELKAELDSVKAELNTLKNPPVEGAA